MASAKPLLWLLPGFAFIAMTLAVAAARGEALTKQQRLVVQSWVASAASLGFIKVSIADIGIMGIEARWERAMLRCLMLISVALNVLPCFAALDFVAGKLGAGARDAFAVVTLAMHLRLGWVAIFGV